MGKDEIADKELIERYVQKGDNRAFELLYSRYRNLLYYKLHDLLPNNKNDVDDLFQKTWLKVIDNLPKYKDTNQFGAWLTLIARNLFIDHVRKSNRGATLSAFNEGVLIEEIDENVSNMPWYELDREDDNRNLNDALKELSEVQLKVYQMRLDNMAFKDIANELNLSINTVLSHMSYAKKKLKLYLKNMKEVEK